MDTIPISAEKEGSMTPEKNTQPTTILDIRPLREQVYEYLRSEMQARRIIPGSLIRLNEISERLGISKTPLRDAVIQLECEGLVTILPRRGVLVNRLTLDEIKKSLEIVGALESAAIHSVFFKIEQPHLNEMERLNKEMRKVIQSKRFTSFDPGYYELNIAFHNVFLDLSNNDYFQKIITPIKRRLYDFPRFSYIREWEAINCNEHEQLIEYIKQGDQHNAVILWKDSHWSFKAHESYIRDFYSQGDKHIQDELKRFSDRGR